MKRILQNSKLLISRDNHDKNEVQNIQAANQNCAIISLLDSFVIRFVFSMKNKNILHIIQKIKANK